MSAKGDCPKRSRLPPLKGYRLEKSQPLRVGGWEGVRGVGVCDVCRAAHTLQVRGNLELSHLPQKEWR